MSQTYVDTNIHRIQWNPLNTKLKGLMKSVHVIRIIRNTRGIAGVIFYFQVNQNLVLSEFVLSGFHCTSKHTYILCTQILCKHTVHMYVCMYVRMYYRNMH